MKTVIDDIPYQRYSAPKWGPSSLGLERENEPVFIDSEHQFQEHIHGNVQLKSPGTYSPDVVVGVQGRLLHNTFIFTRE
jgi:hypothetical protein